ncbi:hypothetical protein [Niveibacterium sp. SC-1]|uniref:hypothetical protein n=1 Tax=Niveibacterium sp. SC-1 TaxID=3135646 RepID=UPI00311DADF7
MSPRIRLGLFLSLPLLAGTSLLAACNSFATPTQSHIALPAERLLALEGEAAANCVARRGADHLPPHRFTTDGCSMWPDGNWQGCCVRHDEDYWCGGEDAAREASDGAFRQCVSEANSPVLAGFMYWGVRAGGAPMLPVPWRWGYGWEYGQGQDVQAQRGRDRSAPDSADASVATPR